MADFYLCSVASCNRKYKTEERLKRHLLNDHEIVDEASREKVTVTQKNKKSLHEARNRKARQEQEEEKKKEILRKKALEEKARQDMEELFLEKYKKEKVELQEKRLLAERAALEAELLEKENKVRLLAEEKERALTQEQARRLAMARFKEECSQEEFDLQKKKLQVEQAELDAKLEKQRLEQEQLVAFHENLKRFEAQRHLQEMQTLEKRSTKENSGVCAVCMEEDESVGKVVLLPCRHAACCEDCTNLIVGHNNTCPMCRGSIASTIKIYTS